MFSMFRTLFNIAFGIILRIWAPWIYLIQRLLRTLTSPFFVIYSKIFSRCTSVVYTTVILASTSFVLLWTSILLYGSFYNSYVPTVSHQRDVNLVFSSDCELAGEAGMCTFPKANMTLGTSRNAEILRKGQAYQVMLELDMPETPVNQQLGMFMVELTFYSYNGVTIQKASRAVSGMLRYKSYLLQVVETIFYLPLLLVGYREQKQTLDIELFRNYVEDTYKPTVGVVIEVQTRSVHIYNSVLHLHAIFSGLRYFMYRWPLTSSLLGITTIFFFLAIIVLLSFYKYGSSKYKYEASSYSEYASYPSLNLDEMKQVKQGLYAAKDKDVPSIRGAPDGDGTFKDDSPVFSDDDPILTSKSSKVEDVPARQYSFLRHRKHTDSTDS